MLFQRGFNTTIGGRTIVGIIIIIIIVPLIIICVTKQFRALYLEKAGKYCCEREVARQMYMQIYKKR